MFVVFSEYDLGKGGGRTERGRDLGLPDETNGPRDGDEAGRIDAVAAMKLLVKDLSVEDDKNIAHLTPLRCPPFSTQTRSPALLIATEIGKSPSLETGSPIAVKLEGLVGSIANADTVFAPA